MSTIVSLELAPEPVALDASNVEHVSRIRARSNYDGLSVKVTLTMRDGVYPEVTVTPVDGSDGTATKTTSRTTVAESDRASGELDVGVSCSTAIPCSVDSAVAGTAAELDGMSASGVLEIAAGVRGGADSEGVYLSVELLDNLPRKIARQRWGGATPLAGSGNRRRRPSEFGFGQCSAGTVEMGTGSSFPKVRKRLPRSRSGCPAAGSSNQTERSRSPDVGTWNLGRTRN